MRKPALLISLVLVLALLGGTGYLLIKNGDTNSADGTEKVSVRMKWFFAGTMVPWFAGKEKGFYRDARIDLDVHPGGPDNNAVKLVAAGTDLFGVAGADEVLMAREKGIPVVAIAVLFKESPICFISKKAKGITSPEQWSGKIIEVNYGSSAEVQYRALVKKFALKEIKEVPYTFNLVPFLADKVDVSVAYRMDQVVTLERKGIDLNIISPKDYGINPYGDVVITTEKTLRDKPELVQRFIQATVKSVQWSIQNPQEGVSFLVKGAPELKADNELAVWNATIPFLTAEGGESKVGLMKKARWQESMDPLVEFGFMKGPTDLENVYKNITKQE